MSMLITGQSVAQTSYFIRYYPGLKTFFGCEKAAIIVDRLEYWFKKYHNGFYKFLEPCDHYLYHQGDSWVEELGWVRITFNKAFDKIGIRYKSKSAFLKAEDKFQGKLYASYYDRISKKTFYIRNHNFVNELLHSLFKKNKKSNNTPSSQKEISVIERKSKTAPKNPPKIHKQIGFKISLPTETNVRSSGGIIGGKIDKTSQQNNPKQKITPFLRQVEPKKANNIPLQSQQIAKKMKEIWQEEIGDLGVSFLSHHLRNRLYACYADTFDQSMDNWQQYCRQIASSKCLMGGGKNKDFRPWITWAIKPETYERIQAGEFVLGDRPTKANQHQEILNLERQGLQVEKQKIENSIELIRQTVEQGRRKAINDHIGVLTEKEREKLKNQFVQSLQAKDDDLLRECQEKFWQNKWAQMRFDWFVREQIATNLFAEPLEQEVAARVAQTNLRQELQQLESQIQQLTVSPASWRREGRGQPFFSLPSIPQGEKGITQIENSRCC